MKNYMYIIVLITLLYSQYDYELVDINSSSQTYLENISPLYFQGQLTLHYFGHQN